MRKKKYEVWVGDMCVGPFQTKEQAKGVIKEMLQVDYPITVKLREIKI